MRQVSHVCYTSSMAMVAARELRNNTRSVLDRVTAGESITITVDGRPVATLEPIAMGMTAMTRDQFARDVISHRADVALREELRSMMPDTTADIGW